MMTGAIIGTIAIVLVTIAIGLILDRKAPRLTDPRPESLDRKKLATTHAAGEAPSTALNVRDAQLDKLRTSQRCPECRAVMRGDADDHARYDDKDLLVLHFICPSCSTKRTLYVTTR